MRFYDVLLLLCCIMTLVFIVIDCCGVVVELLRGERATPSFKDLKKEPSAPVSSVDKSELKNSIYHCIRDSIVENFGDFGYAALVPSLQSMHTFFAC